MREQIQTQPDLMSAIVLANRSVNLLQRKCACGGAPGVTDSCAACSNKNLGSTSLGPNPPSAEPARSVQSSEAPPDFSSLHANHSFGRVRVQGFSGIVQTQLTVSQPHDPYEQEADRVAEEVMRSPAQARKDVDTEQISRPTIRRACTDCGEELQRQADDEETEEEDQSVQVKSEPGPVGEVSPAVGAQIENMKGGGDSLPAASRNYFEQRFGHDFSGVRVHADDRAAQSAKAIHALAYTTGQHIVFGAGQYSPETHSGQKLLAHELTHVVQQGGGQEIRREQDTEAQESESEPSGLIFPDMELPPGLSLGLPGAATEAATEEGEPELSAPSEEALVSRSASSDSATTASPEQQAISESPYPTGMSREQLHSEFGSGESLDHGVRASFESRYGHSLAHVRVHTDRQANSLCERFGAEAFAYNNHIAFRKGAYSPHSRAGEKILRHELTHVLRSPVSPSAIFRVPAVCSTNCPGAGAPTFAPFANTGVNCYGYARNFPPSGFLAPGQTAGTAAFTTQDTVRANPSASASDLASILPYFTPAGVKTNTEADLGSQLSSDCTKCCFSPKRKAIAVSADPATGFARIISGSGGFGGWLPMVSSSSVWDFHWYRKDADRSWSQKHGGAPAQQTDESGTVPICNPCTADRNFTSGQVNYNNVVGSWCL